LPASGEVAANTRKMSVCYPPEGFGGCKTAYNSVDAVIPPRRIKIGNPLGFKLLKFKMAAYLKKYR
jgi:hypothetical protein